MIGKILCLAFSHFQIRILPNPQKRLATEKAATMIVQYLSEYITAMNGDGRKIAEFEERYGYTPKPFLRDGINDSRYYKLTKDYPNEESRYTAAVRLFAVVVHESKVAPPRGKQREVIRQWLLWLSGRQDFTSVEELVNLCRRETGVSSADTIKSIINQTAELLVWRNARSVATETPSNFDASADTESEAAQVVAEVELLDNFKNHESYRNADAKGKRAMKKAFAKMTAEERGQYFALEKHLG